MAKRQTTEDLRAQQLQIIRLLTAAAEGDTAYRDLYLQRAAGLLSPFLSSTQYEQLRGQKAALENLLTRIRRAVGWQDWQQVEELTARATAVRQLVDEKHEELALASEMLEAAAPQLATFAQTLPPGYTMTIGGEKAKQDQGFDELLLVLAISVALIFLALVSQFNHAVKPLLVFAAVPYGVVGALAALYVMETPFGFMAFLGVISLVGVIVSHVIVLFDFIEEMHEQGEPLIDSLLDAGIERLRPVMITVGATVFALFPLALHGGPLWEPLCYAQIGGLSVATFIELLLVPVLYAIFVLDLKIVKWETVGHPQGRHESSL